MTTFANTDGRGKLALTAGNICHVWQAVCGDEDIFREAAREFDPDAQVIIDRQGGGCHITVTVGDQTVGAAVQI